VYGIHENQDDAENDLGEVSNKVQQNVPLRIDTHGNGVFLVPAGRARYVACDEVERPVGTRQPEHRAGELAAATSLTRRMGGG
jgi:hypothetical protein